ncbi:MAG: anaerobic ribonucleoside-triphosphate reductase activating protein [Bacillus sp. (in: firmicutes)]
MKIRLAGPITFDSIVDGPGLRMVIWTQGCPHKCQGCHNPQTHDLRGGFEMDVDDVIMQMKKSRLQKGITLSGGEPYLQPKALLPIAQAAKAIGLDVWSYTGFTFEDLLNENNPAYADRLALLQQVDVLVDGKFVEAEKSHDLLFRGSANQRIIDVQRSLLEGTVVLCEEYMKRI